MYKKPKIIQNITIEKIGYGGVGISQHSDGRKIIIAGGVLPGMVCDIIVTRQKKDYTEGRLYHVHSYDPAFTLDKEQVRCPHYVFNREDGLTHDDMGEHKVGCGGCKRQILTYAKQLMLKQQIVTDSFRHIRDIVASVGIQPFVPAPEVFQYRNKIEYSFGKYITNAQFTDHSSQLNKEELLSADEKTGVRKDWQMGFHKQGMFSKVIDVDKCYLVSEEAAKLYTTLKTMLIASGLPVYDQKTHEGFLRHLVVREGRNTGNFLVNLSVSEAQLSGLGMSAERETFKVLLSQDEYLIKTITTFVITVNNGLADVVNGENIHTYILRGEGSMYEKLIFSLQNTEQESLTEASFRVSPFSFFQTNTLGAQRLFQTAMDAVGEVEGHILDLYCGTGSIGISFLKAGKGDKVFGIEIVADAITDAVRNAKINGLADVTYFVAGKAEDLVSRDTYIGEHLDKMQLVIVDPPRDGLHKNVIEFLLHLKRQHEFKLLYISCNPVTMARDIQLLSGEQYTLRSLQPVDMFPHTHHVEMVGVLS